MLKIERQESILAEIEKKQFCSVEALAKQLFVAPVTVRRDLAELETAGRIKRCRGGATIPDHGNRNVPFIVRDKENALAKIRIAQKAAQLIEEGDTIFLDASSTVAHMTDFIRPEQNLTVITNSTLILEKLKGRSIRCYLTGGALVENSHALVGKLAEEAVSSLYADILFFSSQAISEDGVITDFSENETRLRKLMLKHAKKGVFLYDRSKLGKCSLFQVCHADELFQVICEDTL